MRAEQFCTDVQCRAVDGRHWISGIVMPWDQEVTIRGVKECFPPGGMRARPDGAPMPQRYGHQAHAEGYPLPIGRIETVVDTHAGLWIESRLLDHPTADHAFALVDEGIVRGLSAEFRRGGGMRAGSAQGRVSDGVLTGAVLTERPIYAGAGVTATRARTARLDEWLDWCAGLRTTGAE